MKSQTELYRQFQTALLELEEWYQSFAEQGYKLVDYKNFNEKLRIITNAVYALFKSMMEKGITDGLEGIYKNLLKWREAFTWSTWTKENEWKNIYFAQYGITPLIGLENLERDYKSFVSSPPAAAVAAAPVGAGEETKAAVEAAAALATPAASRTIEHVKKYGLYYGLAAAALLVVMLR
jgi:hypothetical protein